MKKYFLNIIIIFMYSMGSGQDCSGPLNITLNGSPTGDSLQITSIIQHVYCADSDEGNILLEINGGSPNYDCIWEDGFNGDYVDELTPGTYSVTITDSNNCEKILSFKVFQIDPTIDDIHLTLNSRCGECHLKDGQSTFLYSDNEYFIRITDVQDGTDVGNVMACLEIEDQILNYFDWKLHPRSFTIEPANGEIMIDFFMTNEECNLLADSTNYSELNEAFQNARLLRFKNQNLHYVFQDDQSFKFENFKSNTILYSSTIKPEKTTDRIKYFIGLKNKQIISSVENVSNTTHSDSLSYYRLLTNPVSTKLEIVASDPSELTSTSISIINRNGQLIQTQKFKNEYLHGKQFDVSELPQGVYFLQINSLDQTYSEVIKFVKY